MNIDPKIEPWLRRLLDGVENSNHSAEVTATQAYAASGLVSALELIDQLSRWPKHTDTAVELTRDIHHIQAHVNAALRLAKGGEA